jgi:TatD DNase family protein
MSDSSLPSEGAPRWIDHHCHLPSGADTAALVAEAADSGVTAMVTVGTSLEESRRAIAVAREFETVHATAGVHPHDATDGIDGIEELLESPEVVAVGECGLDYHYLHSPAEVQRRVFAEQIGLALAHDLPLVIHTREAWDDTFDVLAVEGTPERTIFHCFTGGPVEAGRCLELGAWLSFSGIVTFPSAEDLREAALLCPPDRLLTETDSPYLTPVPFRGRPNRPALVALVGEKLAEVRGETAESIAATTSGNAREVYRLPG